MGHTGLPNWWDAGAEVEMSAGGMGVNLSGELPLCDPSGADVSHGWMARQV